MLSRKAINEALHSNVVCHFHGAILQKFHSFRIPLFSLIQLRDALLFPNEKKNSGKIVSNLLMKFTINHSLRNTSKHECFYTFNDNIILDPYIIRWISMKMNEFDQISQPKLNLSKTSGHSDLNEARLSLKSAPFIANSSTNINMSRCHILAGTSLLNSPFSHRCRDPRKPFYNYVQ